ncbi:hypothetical protein B0O40_1431 [Ruminococcaceae bacterium R-25]|nr:hypothetical protein B0O40_1431 [Ruminococcaceae bacterium R-25]SUQ12038.1 hypothetical protein SAMN06297423_1431 [Oscillospiraceae bacterium]
MNINQQLYETAYKILLSMLPQRLTENDLDKYLQGDRSNPKDLKEVYKAFIRTAQNYQFMPNVMEWHLNFNGGALKMRIEGNKRHPEVKVFPEMPPNVGPCTGCNQAQGLIQVI